MLSITNEILDQDPQCRSAAILEAKVTIDHGNPQGGFDVLASLIFPEHESGTAFEDDELKVLTLKAKALLFLNRLDECEKLLHMILDANHTHLAAVEILGDLNLARGKTVKAIGIYKALLARHWLSNQVYFSLGQAYFVNQEYVAAYDLFLKLKKIGVHSSTLSECIRITRKKLMSDVLKKHLAHNGFDQWMLRLFPNLADDKILAYVNDQLDESRTKSESSIDALSGCKTMVGAQIGGLHFFPKYPKPVQVFLALIDMEDLIKVNRFYGHGMGNRVVQVFGSVLMKNFGEEIFRMDGCAFLVYVERNEKNFIDALKTFMADVERAMKENIDQFLQAEPAPLEKSRPISFLWGISCSMVFGEWFNTTPLTKVDEGVRTSFGEMVPETIGHESVFLKMQLVDKALMPTEYTSNLIKR